MISGDEKTVIKDFIEGKISPEDFQNEVVLNDGLQNYLENNARYTPRFLKESGDKLWVYLACIDIGYVGGRYDLHALVYELFKEDGYKPAKKYADDFRVYLKLLDAVGYVDCPEITEGLIRGLPPVKFSENVKILKAKIKEIFRYDKNPPEWIQEPDWQCRNGKPMIFREQYDITGGCRYVFYDEEGEMAIEQYD